MLAIQINGDSVAFKETDNDKLITCKLDGGPTTIAGTQTMTVKQDGPRTLKVTYSSDGKVDRENTLVLSSEEWATLHSEHRADHNGLPTTIDWTT